MVKKKPEYDLDALDDIDYSDLKRKAKNKKNLKKVFKEDYDDIEMTNYYYAGVIKHYEKL